MVKAPKDGTFCIFEGELFKMSFTKGPQIKPSYAELVALVRDLPTEQQRMLAEELQRSGLKAKWEEILLAFQPNSISEREIVRTCKEVRRKLVKKRYESVARRS